MGNNLQRAGFAFFLLALLLLLSAECVSAASYTVSSSSFSNGTDSHRALARQSDGDLYTCYLVESGARAVAAVAKSTDDGVNWVGQKVFTEVPGNHSGPTIAVDRNDNVHIAFTNVTTIFYSEYKSGVWSTPTNISSKLTIVPALIYRPSMVIDSQDRVHLLFSFSSADVFPDTFAVYLHRETNGTWGCVRDLGVLGWGPLNEYTSGTALAISNDDELFAFYGCSPDWISCHIACKSSITLGYSWSARTLVSATAWTSRYNESQPTACLDYSQNVNLAYTRAAANWTGSIVQWAYYNGSWYQGKNVTSDNTIVNQHPSIAGYADVDSVQIMYQSDIATYTFPSIVRNHGSYAGGNGLNTDIPGSSAIMDYPSAIWAEFPFVCNARTNILKYGTGWKPVTQVGRSYVYCENSTARYYTAYTDFDTPDGYDLIVYARDAETGAAISNFTVSLSTGSSNTTTTGVSYFYCVPGGEWITITIDASDGGFAPGTSEVYLTASTVKTVFLMPIVNKYYSPLNHEVQIRVCDIFGNPFENVCVTAQGFETTFGAWGWLWKLFGYSEDITINNSTMVGRTDSAGEITYLMNAEIKYNLHFYSAADGINQNETLYPKNDRYIYYVRSADENFFSMGVHSISQDINITVTTTEINSTHSLITINYTDDSAGTTNVTIYTYREELSGLNNYTTICYNFSGLSAFENSTIVLSEGGEHYLIELAVNHSLFDYFERAYKIVIEGIRLDLGFEDKNVYTYISLALLIFVGLMFGATSAHQGALVVCMVGWIEYYVGWLAAFGAGVALFLAFATVLTIIGIYITKLHKEGYQ